MFKQGMVDNSLPKVVRKLTEEDYAQVAQNKIDESHAKPIFRNRVEKYNLNMKLVDIHFQFDRKNYFSFILRMAELILENWLKIWLPNLKQE